MFGQLNQVLGAPEQVDAEMFAPGRSHQDTIESLRHVAKITDPFVGEFIGRIPDSIHQALRAAIHSGVRRNLAVTLAWAPSYDYELQVWEAPGGETPGGITILLKSRYPADRHPAAR